MDEGRAKQSDIEAEWEPSRSMKGRNMLKALIVIAMASLVVCGLGVAGASKQAGVTDNKTVSSKVVTQDTPEKVRESEITTYMMIAATVAATS